MRDAYDVRRRQCCVGLSYDGGVNRVCRRVIFFNQCSDEYWEQCNDFHLLNKAKGWNDRQSAVERGRGRLRLPLVTFHLFFGLQKYYRSNYIPTMACHSINSRTNIVITDRILSNKNIAPIQNNLLAAVKFRMHVPCSTLARHYSHSLSLLLPAHNHTG